MSNPTPSSRSSALSFAGVTKRFRSGTRAVTALDNVSLQLERGSITGLIGPDGAGKTTLMRLAAALLRPDDGRVEVLGIDARRRPLAVQASVGYMPQRFGLYEDLSVQENLDLYADLQGVPRPARPQRYAELMQMTGLAPFTQRLAGRLSGGMKQKLGLACTLVHPPRLLLLDEPTVGVDPVSRRELWAIVDRFVREEGTTVLLSTAYLDEAERCQSVVILDQGRVLGHGSPHEFSAPLRGRVYLVRAARISHRSLQERLVGHPAVLDAVIWGDVLRIVTATAVPPQVEELFPGVEGVDIEPAEPRFEDGFIALLKASRDEPASPRVAVPPAEESSATAAAEEGPVITVRDVKRRFGTFYAVRGVTFDVRRGEIFGLLGANGAGKTTTFRMLCGLLPPSAGELRVAGIDVRKTPAAARARIGYMSQRFSLYSTLSVLDNLRFFSAAYGLKGRRRRERLAWAQRQFELQDSLHATSGHLPLGYKQRLAMACALMHDPEIIFLDEPTSGVDPLARREFWHRINALAARGVTVLVTTHFMEEAEYCDRLAIMMAGEILALGSPREIRRQASVDGRPAPTMEDAFIALIKRQEQSSESLTARPGRRQP